MNYVLRRTKRYGRIIACGAISGYNDKSKLIVDAWTEIFSNRLKVEGFIVFDYFSEFPEAIDEIVAVVKSGKVDAVEGVHVEDLSSDAKPLERVPETWHNLFTDKKPRGKLLTQLV